LKRNLFAILLIGFTASTLVQAETTYVGLMYGQISVDDQDSSFAVETDNVGIVLGGIADSGLGFELFYNLTISEDKISVNGEEVAEATMESYGVMIVYQTPGELYVKAKGGLAAVELDFDVSGASGSFDDGSTGVVYGAAVGYQIGNGALELSYLVLPEFNDFEGLDFDADVNLLSLGYNWNF
jgi:hypothetical protein